jgi:site-specific recombinase XerD
MNRPSRPLLVGPLLQSFFSEHLCSHKDASIQTIASYRDTFRLLLSYVQQTAGIEPSALRINDLAVTVILAFLAHLEQQRHNSVRSRHSHALAPVWSGLTVIALWLGHEDVQTTHVYLQADLAMKEKALNKLAPPETKVARFKPCDEVLAFLASL